MKQKIIINKKYHGAIELPETPNAEKVFYTIRNAYARKQPMGVHLLFGKNRIKQLGHYQKGGAWQELLHLELYIAMGERLRFETGDAVALKNSIELINDIAHNHLNIAKRITLYNKQRRSESDKAYLFWDIENFSNVGPMFNDIIDKYEIPDDQIYVAANPNSVFMNGAEWEADLYDYGKTLNSFNFTKCDHGKNVADTVLLESFKRLRLTHSDVYIITYDRELKELFKAACHKSNNLYILSK